ncbi:uncharacterized protein yc1106_04121 [Curvularia clavata]|uniref:tyrosinase n=1 Tax=Curvularia clavata TaxID=95742 RepID=A0A9Q8Z733_CURCL|nr:uncharacterized protein yc1106_04121 [Curvularia clavata]
MSVGIVTGAASRDENGNIYARHEIRDLKDNYPDQWSLYMFALARLQQADQSDPYSFYGIGSIHGRPYQTWGDAPGLPNKIGKAGYCPHDNELFLGWHRPYLALFEQVLSSHVHDIAANAPPDQIKRYLAAANEFRMPYWDWAQGTKTGPAPDIFLSPTIMVRDTSGVSKGLDNPLFSYQFHPLPQGFEGKWRYINTTIRWPASDDPWTPSRPLMFAEAFKNQSNNLVSQTGVAFRSSSFSRFSSTLEDVHGWVHGVIGGGYQRESPYWGHMWPLEYSAFEPLFMLHHANVDRLFALYQAAHPDTWMQPSNVGTQTNVFLADNQQITADTPLLPFRKDANTFWTTNACRDTTSLGYSYPETQRWKFASDESYQANAASVIARLYSGRMLAQKNNMFTDWSIESSVPTDTFRDTFRVQFGLAPGGEKPVEVGSWMVLLPSHQKGEQGVHPGVGVDRLYGTASLTAALVDRVNSGALASLEPGDVVPFLRQALVWDVLDDDGESLPKSMRDKVNVTVLSTQARIPQEEGAPIEYWASVIKDVAWAKTVAWDELRKNQGRRWNEMSAEIIWILQCHNK